MGDTTTDISQMSDEDLMAEWTALGDEVQAGKDRLREFSAEHQRRNRKAQLLAAMGTPSEEDLALLQEALADGIESQEGVMTGEDEG